MIEVSPEVGCIIYLAAAIGTIIGIWLYQHKESRSQEIVPLHSKTAVCEFCQSTYLIDCTQLFTRCPECQSINKNIK